MKIKNVKPGDIINISKEHSTEKENYFFDDKWEVIKVYEYHVLTRSVRMPEFRRSFCLGDLVMLGIENGGSEKWI